MGVQRKLRTGDVATLIALFSGRESRDVMMIIGDGDSMDVEFLAQAESPRSVRVWESHEWFSKARPGR